MKNFDKRLPNGTPRFTRHNGAWFVGLGTASLSGFLVAPTLRKAVRAAMVADGINATAKNLRRAWKKARKRAPDV